jgi:phosphate transport system protein
MASDLRGVLVALWMIGEVERCGDLAANLSKAARRLYHSRIPDGLQALLPLMGTEATSLLRLAIDAYEAHDASVAAALDDFDDRLDALHRRWLGTIFESHRDGGLEVEAGVQLALVGRYYERIGDHAVNIGNRVVYLVTGWLPEHTGAARVEARRHLHDLEEGAAPGDVGTVLHDPFGANMPPPTGLDGADDTVEPDGVGPADRPDEEQ